MNGQARRIKGGVAISFVLAGALVIGQGCGSGFLGLEDYQRDLLLGGLAVAILSQQDAGGDPIGAPVDGRDGVDGVNCWDLNGDGVKDTDEDTNGDGSVDVLDCRGSDGATGADGADGTDGANGANGTNGSNGSDGSTGPRGPAGPEFFDVWVDDFFGFDDRTVDGAAIIEDPRLPIGVISLDEPVLRWESESPIAYRVAVPPRYDAGNDVTMRLFLYRTGQLEGDCMILTLDARRLRDGTGVEAYERDGAELSVPGRRWIRVDGAEADDAVAGNGVQSGVMVMVDLPLNTAAGLNYGNDLMAGDFLAFELNVYQEDGRSYQMIGAEFYETPTGSARSWNAAIFEMEDDVNCGIIDCNENGIADGRDILDGTSFDCNEDGVPDECAACPPLDIVFLMDTSGSMQDEGVALCESISGIVAELASLGITANPEILAIAPHDTDDIPPCVSGLSQSVESRFDDVVPGDNGSCPGTLTADGDSEKDENWAPATAIVAASYPWSDGAIRMIVPVSDEGACLGNDCEDPGEGRDAVENAIAIANDNNVIVSPIAADGSSDCVITLAKALAVGTGGSAFSSSNAGDIAGAISESVELACRLATDCNLNDVPDECEIEGNDCNGNSVLDICEMDENDCNENDVLDACELCENIPAVAAAAGPAALPFTFMQDGFTQELYATSAGFMGGVAFAPDGDVLVDACSFGGSSLRRFDAQTTTVINGSTVHPFIGALPSDAGCGLTNHPDGSLYSNTGSGVSNLNADTGAVLRPSFGPAGNALGIAPDPQTGDLVYVGSDGTLRVIDAGFTTSSVYSTATTGKSVDGIYFDQTGDFLFCSNRTDRTLTIVARDGSLVQAVPIADSGGGHEPDGIAFHATDPKFVVTINLDGTMTRFDFPGDDFTQAPTTSLFASGGFRGDLSQVGSDGCLYLTQNSTRFADGTISGDNSVVRVCGEFNPGVPSDLVLSPQEAINAVGTSHTVTATFSVDSDPVEGATVHFEVFAGPNAPMTGSANTGPGGEASFTYDGLGGLGIDQIQASVVGETGTKFSNIVTKTWVEPDCSQDCNGNGIPDECELAENDCNENGIPDDCDGGCEECVCHEDISTVCQPFDTVNTASFGMPVFYDEPVTDGQCMFGCVDPGQTAAGECSVECNWNSGNLFPVGDTIVTCTSYFIGPAVAGFEVDECSFTVTVEPYTVPCAGTFTGSWNSGELSGDIEGELLTDGTVIMTFLNLLDGSSMRADGLVSECGEISAFNSEFQMSVIGSMFADDGCYGRGEFGGGKGQSGTWGVTIDVP